MTSALTNHGVQILKIEEDAALEAIKEWLAKQPHLPDTWDDVGIRCFLRWANFSLEKTKKKLDKYFTITTAAPELFTNRDVNRPELQKMIKQLTIPILPKLTPDGYRVTIFRANADCVLKFGNESTFKISLMLIHRLLLMEHEMQAVGDVFILDGSTLSLAHHARTNLSLLKKFAICIMEAYPGKIKGIHFINAQPLISTLYSFVRPLIREKIVKRSHIHSKGLESLYEFVPKDVLPEEYGGAAGALQDLHEESMKKLEECTSWFLKHEQFKVDESKRPGKPINFDDLFGIDGSFKQLTID